MHHHPVVVVNRATSQETTGEEDMDTVPAPQPGGRNGIHIHVPGGLPGASPADHPATTPTKSWWIDFRTSPDGAAFPVAGELLVTIVGVMVMTAHWQRCCCFSPTLRSQIGLQILLRRSAMLLDPGPKNSSG